MSEECEYTVLNGDDEERRWSVETVGEGRYEVTTPDGRTLEVDAFSPDDDQLHMLVGDESVEATFLRKDSDYQVQVDSERHELTVLNERQLRMRKAGAGAGAGGSPELVSPMAGQVVKFDVEVGDEVEAGDRVVVVEAMKMENDLEAHKDGVIESIAVEAGESVDIDDVLVVIGDPDE